MRASTLELLRYPAFSLPTLLFPATVYLVVASGGHGAGPMRMAGFAGIAVLGVAFFQFGVGIANDRTTHWERYLRTLPAPPATRIAGRVLSALVFAAGSAAAVVLAALGIGGAGLPWPRWPVLAAALLAGAVPFALLGIALGYLVRPKAALPIANLLYLPLAYAGGLWSGPAHPSLGGFGLAVPTHAWAGLLWWSAGAVPFELSSVAALAGWTCLFGLAAIRGYRRDEGERFR